MSAGPNDVLVRLAGWVLQNRRLVRAPIGLYRRGWGRLLGSRLLMLEHRGRRSGSVRRVVLEVLGRPDDGRYLVVAGFGDRAQWLRNVRVEPRVRVSSGRLRSVPARAHELPLVQARAALASYAHEHPIAWQVLSATMEQSLGTDLTQLPVVAIDVTSGQDRTSGSVNSDR